VRPSFVAGFGPIVRVTGASRAFWRDGRGITLEESSPGYWTNDDLDGINAFALWPLSQAAEACFGKDAWPADLPEPQACRSVLAAVVAVVDDVGGEVGHRSRGPSMARA
jgi:hypothetical protein